MMVQGEVQPGVVYPPPNQGQFGYQPRGYPPTPQYPTSGYYDTGFAGKVVQKPFQGSPYHNETMDDGGQEEEDEAAWEAVDHHPGGGWKNEYQEPGYGGGNRFQSSHGGKYNNDYNNGSYYEETIPVAGLIRPPPRRAHSVGRGGFGGSQQYPAFEHKPSPVYQKPPPEYWGAQEGARPVYQKPPEYWSTKEVKPSYPKPGFQKPEYWGTKDVQPGFQKPSYVKPGIQTGYPKQEYWAVKGV